MASTPDDRLRRLCRRNLGVFTVQQALACGVPRSTIYARVAAGRYVQRWPGVLAVAAAPDGREARWLAALRYVGGDAALARRTAAELHGLEHRLQPDAIHLLVRDRSFAPRPGLVIHRSRGFAPSQSTRIGRLAVTNVTRTICDLAGEVDPATLRRLVSAGVRSGATDARALRRMMRTLGRCAGTAGLREVVEELSPLEAHTRSELESRFLRITTAAGIPPTAMNHPVVDVFGVTRVLDAVYLPERQPVELDSRAYHGTLLDWHDDLRREAAVRLVGWRDPLRFSWADLDQRAEQVVDVIRRALARARSETALA